MVFIAMKGVCVGVGILMKSDSCYIPWSIAPYSIPCVCVHVCLSRQASVPDVQGQH